MDARTYPALDLTFPSPVPLNVGAAARDVGAADQGGIPDRVSTVLDDLGPAAIHEMDTEMPPRWRVFFGSPAARDVASATIAAVFAGEGLSIAAVDVSDEDWAARTQAALRAVRVGRIVVAPPWDVPAPDAARSPADELVVIIEPSTGFGTGHHESTRLCLELLQTEDLRGRRVLDVGTGSGVLAIVAARLGARDVLGLDDDADAVECARENAGLVATAGPAGPTLHVPRREASHAPEGQAPNCLEFATTDLRKFGCAEPYDVALANLTGALLVTVADHLAALVRPGGTLIIAGFQTWEAERVLAAFAPHARAVEQPRENGWAAARLVRAAR